MNELKRTWGQNFTSIMRIFKFMEKAPCTKIFGVLINFHEDTKLQSFEIDLHDVITANYKTFHLWFFYIFLLILWRKNLLPSFTAFLNTFHELMKLGNLKLCLDVGDVFHDNQHLQLANSGLHVSFWNLWVISFCFMMKKDIWNKSCYFNLRSLLICSIKNTLIIDLI